MMTKKQAKQFNAMLRTLRRIGRDYMTPKQLQRDSEKLYGLDFAAALEIAYESIQDDARSCIRGIKEIVED